MNNKRDNFGPKTIDNLGRRASFICSNPDCRCITLCPSEKDPEKYIYTGKAAHITAAAEKGPRYDPSLTEPERSSIENGIFLCSNCADMIDKNKGMDYSVELLKKWKSEHEKWIKENLNKSPYSPISIIDGEHHAKGQGNVTGLDIQESVILKPGTKSTAEGVWNITGTRIGNKRSK